jgi:kumamolisin
MCGLAAVAGAQSSVVLSGHMSARVRNSTRLARAAADEHVDLALAVNLDQALLDATLARLYGPGAPANKTFLTPAEFASTFDLAAKRQALKDFARAQGLTVSANDNPYSQTVRVSGPSAVVENAFGVRLFHYRSPEGQVFRAADGDPSIPNALAPHLRAVLGLSNFQGARRPHVRHIGARPAAAAAAAPRLTGSGPSGGLAPADVKTIYGLTSGTLTGSGVGVALVELDGYNASDVTLYENTLFPAPHPNVNVTCVSADNSCGLCYGANATVQNESCATTTPASDSNMAEVMLDVDMVIALSSGVANLKLYTALNQDPDDITVLSDIAADSSIKVVSSSWGEDQQALGTSDMSAENSIFQQMATEGQSMFASSGDNGAFDGGGVTVKSVDDPASQPYVTGVGGTSLSGSVGSHTETVWNDGCVDANSTLVSCGQNGASYEAGGGGVANYSGDWPQPSYQSGVVATTGQVSTTYRNVPDVALNADPDSAPYAICVGGSCDNLYGGTSAAAPLWAALAALIDQKRAANASTSLGFANPSIYALAGGVNYSAAFNDVTSGNNGYYDAGVGFDDATGWGSFKADALIAALASPPAAPSLSTASFSSLGTGSFTVSFDMSGAAAGTVYTVQASTSASFASFRSSATAGSSVSFAGLLSNATYYVRADAKNFGIQGAYGATAATATLVGAPLVGAAPFGTSSASLELSWSSGTLAPGTSYLAQVSASASPFTPAASAVTTSTYAVVTGLSANTTYYAQVQAQSASSDPNGAFTALGAGATWANAVTAGAFSQVFVSSLSVAWTPLPSSPQAATAESTRVDLSTSPTFAALTASSSVPTSASAVQFTGLSYGTTYYARVASLNWQGAASYFNVPGSTTTGGPVLSTGVVSGGGLVLSLSPLAPPLISVTVTIPGGAFPAGTDASAIAGFFGTPLSSLSGATSSEAPITALGASAAFCVSGSVTCLYSGGPQPSVPIIFSIAYDAAQLPAGGAESAIQLMRYDPTAGGWTLVPSQDNPSTHVLTAYSQHLSLFAPFFVAAAASGDLAPVQIFPQPWELGAPGSAYFATVLTFSNLPAGADVKIYTIAGELVWEGSASVSGVATWNGANRFGRAAASGTYLVSIDSGGSKRLRRVVLIR